MGEGRHYYAEASVGLFAQRVKFSLAQGRQSTLFSFNLRRGRFEKWREREREKVMHSDVKRLSALLPSSP